MMAEANIEQTVVEEILSEELSDEKETLSEELSDEKETLSEKLCLDEPSSNTLEELKLKAVPSSNIVQKFSDLTVEQLSSKKILEQLKRSFDTKIDTLNRQVEGLNNELISLKTEVSHGAKMQSLEWAIDNVVNFGTFEYRHTKVNPNSCYASSDFVRSVLIWFRKGQGTFIDENIYVDENRIDHPPPKAKAAFRDKLVEQLLQLTGQKPRVVLKEDGRYSIHFK